jgi:hypothetical protein
VSLGNDGSLGGLGGGAHGVPFHSCDSLNNIKHRTYLNFFKDLTYLINKYKMKKKN